MKRVTVIGLLLILALASYKAFAHGVQSHSGGDGNTANVNYCSPTVKVVPKVIYKTRWKTKIVYRDRPVVKYKIKKVVKYKKRRVVKVEQGPKNAISVLGGVSKTGLGSNRTGNTTIVDTNFEPDFGLMYQHDFGRVRTSVSGSIRQNFMLGVGLTF